MKITKSIEKYVFASALLATVASVAIAQQRTINGFPVPSNCRNLRVIAGKPVCDPPTPSDIGAASASDLAGKLDANTPITPGTKTKITYDADGLVTAGADATTADIADSAGKRYVTDAQLTVIGNTSGTNTGDQTSVSGNAGTATALQTARTINTDSFDGTANIQNTLASADFANQGTATTLLHGNAAGNPSWGAVVEADQTLADNTTNDVSVTKHGYAPKAPNDTAKFLRGDASWAAAAPAGATYITQTADGTLTNEQALSALSTGIVKVTTTTGVISSAADGTDYLCPAYGEKWDVIVSLSSAFTVTNGTLQDVTGFTASATSGLTYEVEVLGSSSADTATGDIAIALGTTGTWGTGQSWRQGVFYNSSGSLVSGGGETSVFDSTTLSTASPGLTINNGDAVTRPFRIRFLFTATADGTVTLKMGQTSAAAGRTSTLNTGTRFSFRRIG